MKPKNTSWNMGTTMVRASADEARMIKDCANNEVFLARRGLECAIATGNMLPWWRTTARQTLRIESEAGDADRRELDALRNILAEAELISPALARERRERFDREPGKMEARDG